MDFVGFSGEIVLPDHGLGFFGLRPVEGREPRVRFYPVPARSADLRTNLLGVKAARFTVEGKPFIEQTDLRKFVATTEVIPAIERAVKHGHLDESGCAPMLIEQVVWAVLNEQRVFSELRDEDGWLPDCIRLDDVSQCLLRRKLECRYRDELVRERIDSGEILVTWTGGGMSYSIVLSDSDRALIADKVEENIDRGVLSTDVSAHVDFNRLDEVVSLAIHRLKQQGVRDVSLSTWRLLQGIYRPDDGKARRLIGEYIKEIYLNSLSCYLRIRSANFPAWRDAEKLDAERPASAFFVVPAMIDTGTPVLDIDVMIFYVESDPEGVRAEVVDEAAVVYDCRSFSLTVHGTSYALISAGYRQVRRMLDRIGGLSGLGPVS